MSNISIKQAAFINFISRYSNVLIQLFINSILARVLTPNDYGVVAVVSVFTTFFSMLADMGIGPAIIQNKELDDKDISNIFLFTVITGFIVSVLFALFSYPISIFYDNDIYIELCKVLSISIFFNVINIVPNALVLKNKLFKVMGIRMIIITILGGIITIFLALNGFKYYSLVFNSVFISISVFISNVFINKFKIYMSFSLDSIKKIQEFSKYAFGYSLINYFARNLDNILIGKYIGNIQLGYYDKAYRLMLYPIQNFTHVITPTLQPIFSEYQDDKDKIYESYIKVLKLLSMGGIFFSVLCFWASKEIIIIMFGYKWVDSIESFKILSLSIWPQMLVTTTGALYQSINETRLWYKTGLITTCISIVMIILGILTRSIESVSFLISITYYLFFVIFFYSLVKIGFKKSFLSFLNIFSMDFFILLIMLVSVNFFTLNVNDIFLSVVYKFLGVLICFFIAIYIGDKKYMDNLISGFRRNK